MGERDAADRCVRPSIERCCANSKFGDVKDTPSAETEEQG